MSSGMGGHSDYSPWGAPPPLQKKLAMTMGLYHVTNPRKTFSATRFEIAKRSKRCATVSLLVTGHGEGFRTPHIQYQGGYPQNGTVYYNFLKHSSFFTKYSMLNAETRKASKSKLYHAIS